MAPGGNQLSILGESVLWQKSSLTKSAITANITRLYIEPFVFRSQTFSAELESERLDWKSTDTGKEESRAGLNENTYHRISLSCVPGRGAKKHIRGMESGKKSDFTANVLGFLRQRRL